MPRGLLTVFMELKTYQKFGAKLPNVFLLKLEIFQLFMQNMTKANQKCAGIMVK